MSERGQVQSAKDTLAKETDGLIFDKIITPGRPGYISLPGDNRPLGEQEPLLRFRKPERVKDVYKHRLTDIGGSALLEHLGISRQQIKAREEMHEVFQDGFEQGRQSAGSEVADLREELSTAQQEIERLKSELGSLEAEVESLKKQLAELTTASAADGNQAPAAPAETSEPATSQTGQTEVSEPATEATPPATESEPASPEAADTPAEPQTTTPAETADPPADIVPEGTFETTTTTTTLEQGDQPEQSRWERLRARFNREDNDRDGRGRTLGVFVVGMVVGGALVAAIEIAEHKFFGHSSSREARHHFLHDRFGGSRGHDTADAKLATSRFNAAMKVIAGLADHKDHAGHTDCVHKAAEHMHSRGGQATQLIDINKVHSDTITAHSPVEFQKNVVQLLRGQGLRVNGDTPQRLARMSQWMHGQRVASGVNSDHSQNLVKFSADSFSNPSHESGFKAGADGSGDSALHGWVNHAKSIGINISA